MVAIAKHPATYTKASPKYVAPNLRGPKLVWVPSKSGWICVGTIGIGGLIQLISYYSSYDWVKYWSLVHIQTQCHDSEVQMCYNIQVSHSSCGDLLDYLMACNYMSWSLQIRWSWTNQGISLLITFIWVHMSWLNWINMQCCLL